MITLPILKRFQAIRISWIDANSQDGWVRPEAYDEWKKEKLVVHTLGFYLDSDGDFLRICFGRALWDGVPRAVINAFAIPLVNILDVQTLEESNQ